MFYIIGNGGHITAPFIETALVKASVRMVAKGGMSSPAHAFGINGVIYLPDICVYILALPDIAL